MPAHQNRLLLTQRQCDELAIFYHAKLAFGKLNVADGFFFSSRLLHAMITNPFGRLGCKHFVKQKSRSMIKCVLVSRWILCMKKQTKTEHTKPHFPNNVNECACAADVAVCVLFYFVLFCLVLTTHSIKCTLHWLVMHHFGYSTYDVYKIAHKEDTQTQSWRWSEPSLAQNNLPQCVCCFNC